MNCLFGTYEHVECGRLSECERTDKHHHHKSPGTVEVISPGDGGECFKTFFGRNKA